METQDEGLPGKGARGDAKQHSHVLHSCGLCLLGRLVLVTIKARSFTSANVKQYSTPVKKTDQCCPGGTAVKNLPCNARDAGSIPGLGTKIPHAVEQLSLSSTSAPQ